MPKPVKSYPRTDPATLAAIPAALRAVPQFVCWRVVAREDQTTAKVPVDPRTGHEAKVNDPATWADHDTAVRRFMGDPSLHGVGFVFTATDPWTGVDIDDCRDPETGKLGAWAETIVQDLDSYAEVSPSGTGVKIIVMAEVPGTATRRNKIEIYSHSRYFTLTGRRLPKVPKDVQARQGPLVDLYQTVFGRVKAEPPARATVDDPKLRRVQAVKDDDLLERAREAANGPKFTRLWGGDVKEHAGDHSRADAALCAILAYWTRADAARIDRLFRASKLMRKKWDERRGERTYGQRTVDAAVRAATALYDPDLDAAGVQNDLANTEVFIQLHGERFAWCGDWRSWLAFNSHSWHRNQDHVARRAAEDVSAELVRRAQTLAGTERFTKALRWAVASGDYHRMANVEQIARSRLYTRPEGFDRDPWLLGVGNGVVDLRTGERRDGARGDWMTRGTEVPYVAGARCPRWDAFLGEIMEQDQEMVAYLWRVLGYCLTGDTSERAFFILHGSGRNGKTTFVETLLALVGGYGQKARFATFLRKTLVGSGANDDVAHLVGARVVAATEGEATMAFDMALVKELTGADKVRARFLYGKEFEFKPNFKLLFATNQVPTIHESTYALWDRLHYIPFDYRVREAEVNPRLPLELLGELEGILARAVMACLEWQREGLKPPEKVLRAGAELQKTMDIFGQFLAECVQNANGARVAHNVLYTAFATWAKDQGMRFAPSSRALASYLKDRKYTDRRGHEHVKYWVDIRLRAQVNEEL